MNDEYDDILQESDISSCKTLSEAEVSEQATLKSDAHF